jgi:hypothetical protein
MTNRAIFECQSTIEVPTKVLTLTLDDSNDSSLGIQLAYHDNGLMNEMFVPGYASVGKSHTLSIWIRSSRSTAYLHLVFFK